MSVGMVPLPVPPARAPSSNLFSLSSKPFACHTSKESPNSSKLWGTNPPATPLDSILSSSNSFAIHTSTHAPDSTTVIPFESAPLSPNFFICHRSAKCASNSFICHTSKKTTLEVLCLPHIRDPRGWLYVKQNSQEGLPARAIKRTRTITLEPVTNHQSPLTLNCELSTVDLFSSPVRRIDAHVLRREVAGPIAGHGFAGVQIHYQRNVFGKKFVAGGAFVEIERLLAPQHRNARHFDVHQSGVKLYAGPPSGGKNAAPVRVAAREGGFHQRRSRDGFRDALRRGFRLGVAHFDFDDALRAFAVGHDLQRERAAYIFQRGSEGAMRRRARFDRRCTRFTVGQYQQRVVRRSVAIHADRIEGAGRYVAKSFLQEGRSDCRIRGDERQHRRHVRMDHPRAFRAAHEMDSFPRHLKRSGGGLRARVRGANSQRSFREGACRRAPKTRDDRQRAQNFLEWQRHTDDAGGADKQFLRHAPEPLRCFCDCAHRSGVAGFARGAVRVACIDNHGAHAAF